MTEMERTSHWLKGKLTVDMLVADEYDPDDVGAKLRSEGAKAYAAAFEYEYAVKSWAECVAAGYNALRVLEGN